MRLNNIILNNKLNAFVAEGSLHCFHLLVSKCSLHSQITMQSIYKRIWTRRRTSHNHKLQYLSNSKTASNSCSINLGHTGPDGVQTTIISYNIHQTQKLLITHVVLTLATLDQMVYKSQFSYNIYQTLKLLVTHVV